MQMSTSLYSKIETIKRLSYKQITSLKDEDGTPYLKYVFDIHAKYFGQVCQSCASKVPGYIKMIKEVNLNKPIMAKTNSKYKLRSGKVVSFKGAFYSEHNITDEIAAAVIKQNPNRSHLFAKVPADGPATVEEDKVTAATLEAGNTRKELDAIAKQFGLDGSKYGNKTEVSVAIEFEMAKIRAKKAGLNPEDFNDTATILQALADLENIDVNKGTGTDEEE